MRNRSNDVSYCRGDCAESLTSEAERRRTLTSRFRGSIGSAARCRSRAGLRARNLRTAGLRMASHLLGVDEMNTDASRRIRYAVAGMGNIAQAAVLPAFAHAENSELAALISGDAEKLATLGEKYGISATGGYDDLERIAKSAAIDALYVTTPNALHAQLVERAAAAGLHVLCEKPLASNVAECQSMIDSARRAKVKLMTAYRLHFEETNLEAIARLFKGEIGFPRLFSSIFSHQVRLGNVRTSATLGGGALFDMGVYCINAARYLFRAEPIEVSAFQVFGTDARSTEVDETTTAILVFSGGRVAQFTASQGAADVAEYRVVGTSGDIRLDPAFEYHEKNSIHVTVDGNTESSATSKRDQFAPELVYFSRCILEDLEPEPSGEEGLADVRIMDAVIQSAKLGRRVPLEPFERSQRPTPNLEMHFRAVGKVEPIKAPAPSE